MAWMSDEQYELMQDTKEKKITARSAKSTRTHNGKSGCTFSHERMTKKEIKAMSGECKTYRMNDPMTWAEFKEMPDDLKVCYVKALRKKYEVPDKKLADMFGISASVMSKEFTRLGLNKGVGCGKRNWNKDGFYIWLNGEPVEHTVEELDELVAVNEDAEIKEYVENDISMTEQACEERNFDSDIRKASEIIKRDMFDGNEPTECCCTGEVRYALPSRGEMTFQGHIEEILRTVNKLLDGKNVWLEVKWLVRED